MEEFVLLVRRARSCAPLQAVGSFQKPSGLCDHTGLRVRWQFSSPCQRRAGGLVCECACPSGCDRLICTGSSGTLCPCPALRSLCLCLAGVHHRRHKFFLLSETAAVQLSFSFKSPFHSLSLSLSLSFSLIDSPSPRQSTTPLPSGVY